MPLSLSVIIAVVASEPQIALPLAKPHQFLKLGHLRCSPSLYGMEALQAPAHIVVQAVCDSVLGLKYHEVLSFVDYGCLIALQIDPLDAAIRSKVINKKVT